MVVHTAVVRNGFERIRRFAFQSDAGAPTGAPGSVGLGPEDIDAMTYDELCDMLEALRREFKRKDGLDQFREAQRMARRTVAADRGRWPALRAVSLVSWAVLLVTVALMLLYGHGNGLPVIVEMRGGTLDYIADAICVNIQAYLLSRGSAVFTLPMAASLLTIAATRVVRRHRDDRIRYGLTLLFLTNGFSEERMRRVRGMVRRRGAACDAIFYDSLAEGRT